MEHTRDKREEASRPYDAMHNKSSTKFYSLSAVSFFKAITDSSVYNNLDDRLCRITGRRPASPGCQRWWSFGQHILHLAELGFVAESLEDEQGGLGFPGCSQAAAN